MSVIVHINGGGGGRGYIGKVKCLFSLLSSLMVWLDQEY